MIQEAAKKADAFSTGGLIGTKDKGEGDVHVTVLERDRNPTEVGVPIEFVEGISRTEPLPVEVESTSERAAD